MPADDIAPPGQLSPPAMAAWLTMAYRGSQAVIAATKLGVPDALGQGPLTSAEVAEATTTRADTMHRLLRALAAFGVVRDLGDGRFELTAVGDCLRTDAPNSVRAMALMYGSDSSWEACGQLAACVRTGETAYRILHGVDNLYLSGCETFVTGAAVPPVATITALAHRLADHVTERLKR